MCANVTAPPPCKGGETMRPGPLILSIKFRDFYSVLCKFASLKVTTAKKFISLANHCISGKMDTETAHPRGYNQEQDPNIVGHQYGEGEDEHHHEKKSVLKKVKAKAKKIKDTIKKHGHGHNHDQDHGHDYHEGHIPDDHDLDEEDDDEEEEEEIVEDAGVQEAPSKLPVNESAAVKSVACRQPHDLSRPGIAYERSKGMLPDQPAPGSETFYPENYQTKENDPANGFFPGLEAPAIERPRVNFGKTTVIDEESLAPRNTPVPSSHQSKNDNPTKTFVYGEEEDPGQYKVNLQRPKGLEEDPGAPNDTPDAYITTNYQTKVTDPTGKGGEAAGITSILHSLDKTNIHDQQDAVRDRDFPPGTQHRSSELCFLTGSHNQFSPEPIAPVPTETTENSPLVSETMDTTKPQEHPHNVALDKPSNQSSYTEKISSATSAIANKAVSAKNTVASKLGYGEKDQTPANELDEGQDAIKHASAIDYGKKMATTVAEKLTPVYEKVAGAGSTVISKIPGPGTGTASEEGTDQIQEQDKGVSMKAYIVEKLKPSEEDKALSEVISDALHTGKESEEAARWLGTGDERDERASSGSANGPTSNVVGKLKGAVGSWLGKGEGSRGVQQAHDSSDGNEGFSSSSGKRRLQELGN